MLPLALWLLLAATVESAPSSEEILARVADSSVQRRAVAYSGIREYVLRNIRFAKEATVTVRMTYRPGEGKLFTVLERSGSVKLIGIVERLLAAEADASRPAKRSDHDIGPANYRASLRGTETTAGRICYVIDLTPKHKSKYLIKGTVWVDRVSGGVVRLDGATATSVSMWIGSPHITEEFSEIAGFWLPIYTRSVSSGLLLGISELEIRHRDYRIPDLDQAAHAFDVQKRTVGPGRIIVNNGSAKPPKSAEKGYFSHDDL